MQEFRDRDSNPWKVEFFIGDIRRIQRDTTVDLLRLDRPIEHERDKWKDEDGEDIAGWQRLQVDLELVYAVLYSICHEQVKQTGVDFEQFGRLIGPVHQAAYNAFFEELHYFFTAIGRPAQAALMKKTQSLFNQTQRAYIPAVDKMDTNEIAQRLADEMTREYQEGLSALGSKSGDKPALSESTHNP